MNDPNGNGNWTKVAAWTFGIWALMVPLSAGIIVSFQQRALDNQEKTRAEIAELRAEVLQMNSATTERLAGVIARQIDVMRRVDSLEQRHLPKE